MPRPGGVAGIEELPDGRLFISGRMGGVIYDPEADSDARGRESMEIFFDFWRLRDIRFRIDARADPDAELPEGVFPATPEEAAAAYQVEKDKLESLTAFAYAGPYTLVMSGGYNMIERLPDGKILAFRGRDSRNRVWENGVELPMPLTGEVLRDDNGETHLKWAGLAYDSKRDVIWMWGHREQLRDKIYAARLKEVPGGFELELVGYQLPAWPIPLTEPYERRRNYCHTANTRLVYHEDLDVLSWYCSTNQGFFVFRPPDQVRDPVP